MKKDAHEDIHTGPYRDLYIYHLKGIVRDSDEPALGDCFVGNWVEDNYSFLFFSSVSTGIVSGLLKNRPDLELIDDYHFPYEQWQGGGIESVKIGNFIITPPWDERDTGTEEIRIVMDPGVVFGNGLHPTTRDCLRAISYIRKRRSFESVLDIGTGTGVLAIAAAYLGAKRVLAVDLNPLSVKTAEKNVRLNSFEDRISVLEGRAVDFVEHTADLVVANIHYKVIKELLKRKQFFEESYHIVFSGLMRSQARDIKDCMKGLGMAVLKEWDHEMTWHTILAGRD